jgi:4-hydroxymandelate oxidase
MSWSYPAPLSAAQLAGIVSLPQLDALARRDLPAMAFEYVDSGAADEVTLRWNRTAYQRIRLRPRVLEPLGPVDTRVTLCGVELPHPILLAPTAYHRLLHPEGEAATARGAAAAGALYVVSTQTTVPIEEIVAAGAASAGRPWFQLYVQLEREVTHALVERVEAAGCGALVVTVDTASLGARDRQRLAGFHLPRGIELPHAHDFTTGVRTFASPQRTALTWDDVAWLRSVARVPVILKGILTGDDAARALDAGVAGIIVSNHGGRNLDTLPATIDALPEVAARVQRRIPVLVDGGIRRGTDIIKAIALGADAVLIGRPYLWGLGLAGAEGVRHAIEILRAELEIAMALVGRASLATLDRGVLWDAD